MTPFFFGSNPADVLHGPRRGLRTLARREDLAFELMESLDRGQQSQAIIYDRAPYDILTYNSTRAVLPREEGLPARRLDAAQRALLTALVETYVSQVRSDVARHKLEHLRSEGIDHLHVAWAGPVARREGHYYRIHGGNIPGGVRQLPESGQPRALGVARPGERLRPGRAARPPAAVPYPLRAARHGPRNASGTALRGRRDKRWVSWRAVTTATAMGPTMVDLIVFHLHQLVDTADVIYDSQRPDYWLEQIILIVGITPKSGHLSGSSC